MPHVSFESVNHWLIIDFTSERLTDPAALQTMAEMIDAKVEALPLRPQVVLNFAGVEFVSSQIIGMMLGVRDQVVNGKHGTLVLCRVGEQVREVLRITRLEKQFTIKERLRDVVGQRRRKPALAGAGANPALNWID